MNKENKVVSCINFFIKSSLNKTSTYHIAIKHTNNEFAQTKSNTIIFILTNSIWYLSNSRIHIQ